MPSMQPAGVTVFAYQVGFGDCFLLRFHYPSGDRHVLIDFGSFPQPDWARDGFMAGVARDIASRCGGKLHAVVATHRHADHINGFADNAGGPIIAGLQPEVVIQPWTEDPDAGDATVPAAGAPGKKSLSFARSLRDMEALAESVVAEATALRGAGRTGIARELQALGMDNIANPSAVRNLARMATKQQRYVHFGAGAGLGRVLPGVKVHVLGPPTLEQTDTIRKQRSSDSNEFWQLQAAASRMRVSAAGTLFPGAAVVAREGVPPHARWFVEKLRSIRGRELLEIVRALDNAMNNTSVILLFEVAGRKLLFPGDAQYENWMFALSQPSVRELLADVDLYKVGHHGSRNATPRSLWNLFTRRSADPQEPRRLTTLVSTMSGHHGNAKRKTEVPRRTLVAALERESTFFNTETINARQVKTQPCLEISFT